MKRRGWATPRRGLPIIAIITVPPLVATALAQSVAGIPVRNLLSDTRSIADLPLYAGAVSYLGVLGWAVGASVLLFAGLHVQRGPGTYRTFLLRGGLVTAWLCLDDLFELHERALAGVGIPEAVTYVTYAAVVLGHFVVSWTAIRQTQWWLLAFAVGAFSVSVGTDFVLHDVADDSLWRLVDEGAKLVGIVSWTAYHVDAASEFMRSSRASDGGSG